MITFVPCPRGPRRPGNPRVGSAIDRLEYQLDPGGGDDSMKKAMALLAVVMMLGAGVAFAKECPLLVKQLKDASANEKDAKKKADADKLIAKAQKEHEDGKHADSVKTADEAAKVLGVKLEHKQ